MGNRRIRKFLVKIEDTIRAGFEIYLIQIKKNLLNKWLVEWIHGNTKQIPNTKNRTTIDQTVSTLVSIIS